MIQPQGEENKAQPSADNLGGECVSPDRRMRRFVGNQGNDLLISAIKQDKIALPGQDSDGEADFDAVIEESGFVDREDLNHLNSSPFFEADDI